jgi:hypothetical protein
MATLWRVVFQVNLADDRRRGDQYRKQVTLLPAHILVGANTTLAPGGENTTYGMCGNAGLRLGLLAWQSSSGVAFPFGDVKGRDLSAHHSTFPIELEARPANEVLLWSKQPGDGILATPRF